MSTDIATESATPLVLDSADTYLGPRATRFFGDGYRRSRRSLSDITVVSDTDGTGRISGTATVRYPTDWSRKGATDQRPHLSTTDVMAIGEDLVSGYLRAVFDLAPSDPRIATLDCLRISAGRTAVEEGLDAFEVEAAVVSTTFTSRPTVVCSSFDCTIGTLKLVVSVQHPRRERRTGTIRAAAGSALPGPEGESALRPFATEWSDRSNTVTDIRADPAALTATATAAHSETPHVLRPQDLVIDAFVVTLQLGQILLYELDGLTRGDSSTLWMRNTEIRWKSLPPENHTPAGVSVALSNSRVIARGAERWRAADIVGDVYGTSTRCSVAHRLPEHERTTS